MHVMKLSRLSNIPRIIQHFFLSGDSRHHRKQFSNLTRVLKPFKMNNLITYRSYIIYLFSYVSRSLSTDNKARILTHHYLFLKDNLGERYLRKLFSDGIECFKECSDEDEYTVVLSSSSMLEFEGSLSLYFMVNRVKIYTLSFTIAPGNIFNCKGDSIIFISCLQRDSKQIDNNIKATKYFKDILPSVILMRVMEAMATSLNIQTCIGISARNQLSLSDEAEYVRFYNIYDEFWLNNGATLVDGNYTFSIPLPQKYIQAIQQKHRNRTIKKRAKLDEIYNESYNTINSLTPSFVVN